MLHRALEIKAKADVPHPQSMSLSTRLVTDILINYYLTNAR